MPKVLIATATLAGVDGPFLHMLRDAGMEIAYPKVRRPLTEEELLVELKGMAACIAGFEPYTRRVISSCTDLRVIARNGVGYDAIDVAAATEHGVAVTVTPGVNQESVAEHTLALMLALARSVIPQNTAIRFGEFLRLPGVPLRGRTLGLVGLGRIGREVAIRAATFRMRILAYEPAPEMRFVEQHGISLVSLEQLLAESDFVSLHVPLTNKSRNLIDARALAQMKPTAFLINTARGEIVSETDLVRALKEGRIAGAGLDVFAQEPPPPNHPFRVLDNVVCTAHTAGIDLQARTDMATLAANAIVSLSRGTWPDQQVINPECRPKFRWV